MAAPPMRPAARVPDVALLVLVQVLFGSLSVVGKVAIPQLGSLPLVAARIGFAAVLLLALERMLVGYRVQRRDWPLIAALSMLGVVINITLFLIGLGMTTAVEATVLITTIPVFTLLVGMAARREPWSPRKAVGIALGLSGVVVLVGAGLEFGSATFLGNLFVVLNALSYSVYLVASRPVVARMPPLTLTAYTFLFAALVTLPMGLWAVGQGHVQPGGPDAVGWAALAFIVLGPTVATYFLVSHVLVRVPASNVAVFIYLQPMVGATLAVLFLQEPITTPLLIASALIFAGVALSTLKPGPRLRRFVPGA